MGRLCGPTLDEDPAQEHRVVSLCDHLLGRRVPVAQSATALGGTHWGERPIVDFSSDRGKVGRGGAAGCLDVADVPGRPGKVGGRAGPPGDEGLGTS